MTVKSRIFEEISKRVKAADKTVVFEQKRSGGSRPMGFLCAVFVHTGSAIGGLMS